MDAFVIFYELRNGQILCCHSLSFVQFSELSTIQSYNAILQQCYIIPLIIRTRKMTYHHHITDFIHHDD